MFAFYVLCSPELSLCKHYFCSSAFFAGFRHNICAGKTTIIAHTAASCRLWSRYHSGWKSLKSWTKQLNLLAIKLAINLGPPGIPMRHSWRINKNVIRCIFVCGLSRQWRSASQKRVDIFWWTRWTPARKGDTKRREMMRRWRKSTPKTQRRLSLINNTQVNHQTISIP